MTSRADSPTADGGDLDDAMAHGDAAGANSFPAQSGLSSDEERDMASDGVVGTFGSIFELADSHHCETHGDFRTLSAVLSDQLGRDCLKMVVTTTRQAALVMVTTRRRSPRLKRGCGCGDHISVAGVRG